MELLSMNFTTFLILSFACFRLTHLIVADVITAPFRAMFVEELEEPDREGRMNVLTIPKFPKWRALIGTLISCPWCVGFWIGLALIAGWYWIPNVTFWIAAVFAISGVGSLLETVSRYWTVHTYSPTDQQLEKFEELKRRFFETEDSGQTEQKETNEKKTG